MEVIIFRGDDVTRLDRFRRLIARREIVAGRVCLL
jgi:hypothetical protein